MRPQTTVCFKKYKIQAFGDQQHDQVMMLSIGKSLDSSLGLIWTFLIY